MDLNAVPVRTGETASEEHSAVVLLMPRYPTVLGKTVGKLLNRSRDIRVRLDNVGCAVWSLIDGKRCLREIGEALSKEFGDEVEPLYPRLVEFMEILRRNRFIEITDSCEVGHVEQ